MWGKRITSSSLLKNAFGGFRGCYVSMGCVVLKERFRHCSGFFSRLLVSSQVTTPQWKGAHNDREHEVEPAGTAGTARPERRCRPALYGAAAIPRMSSKSCQFSPRISSGHDPRLATRPRRRLSRQRGRGSQDLGPHLGLVRHGRRSGRLPSRRRRSGPALGRYVGHTQDGSSPYTRRSPTSSRCGAIGWPALQQITDSAQWRHFGTRAGH